MGWMPRERHAVVSLHRQPLQIMDGGVGGIGVMDGGETLLLVLAGGDAGLLLVWERDGPVMGTGRCHGGVFGIGPHLSRGFFLPLPYEPEFEDGVVLLELSWRPRGSLARGTADHRAAVILRPTTHTSGPPRPVRWCHGL